MLKLTKTVKIGSIAIGGPNPIAIQSMCSTKTYDIPKTVAQIHRLEQEKCEMVRVSVVDEESAKALKKIKSKIHIPLIADIHFDYRLALASISSGIDKVRINPGTIGTQDQMEKVILAAKKAHIPMRIGINAGSLPKEILTKFKRPTPQGMALAAEKAVKVCESLNFDQLVISLKSTSIEDTCSAYRIFAKKYAYPLHIGMTEAGTLIPGIVRNTLGITTLLNEGLGNTIRVSLTDDPVLEVQAAKEILKALGKYTKEPQVYACPTCARTEINLIELTKKVENAVKDIKKPLKIAVMGCIVNGPGEAREADYAVCGGKKQAAIYHHGKFVKTIPEKDIIKELIALINHEEGKH